MKDCNVLIVGAGPVGPDAGDRSRLARHRRHRGGNAQPGQPPEPKCNHVAARTMEIFRRLGLADKVRNAGLPADYPHDISYRTTFTGEELTRIKIPCRRDRFTMQRTGPDCNWPTPEPPHRINQIFLEPILFEHAAAQPRIRILNRTAVEDVARSSEASPPSPCAISIAAARSDMRCRYPDRLRRRALDRAQGDRAELSGDAVVQRVQSTYIRAPGLIDLQRHARAWGTGSINPRRSGMVYAIDGRERWLVHNYMKPDEGDFEEVDRDGCLRTILGVGADFRYEVISKEDWYGRRLIAGKFRDRCAFIAGDAAHIWVPYAGYGMNAGIADAMNLSWLLAAHLNGWAPAAILDAYEAERWPITSQVSRFAMSHAEAEIRRRGAVPDDIEDAGTCRRARAPRGWPCSPTRSMCGSMPAPASISAATTIARRSSPMTAPTPPAYTMDSYTASTVPGCRTPHLWCRDGRSLYDAMGPEFTLLRFDPATEVAALEDAARQRGLPLKILDVRKFLMSTFRLPPSR